MLGFFEIDRVFYSKIESLGFDCFSRFSPPTKQHQFGIAVLAFSIKVQNLSLLSQYFFLDLSFISFQYPDAIKSLAA